MKLGASEIRGRAHNYRLIFSQIWEKIAGRLLPAQTPEAVVQAFDDTAYRGEFEPLASLILRVLREPDFPKRDSEAQTNFLAESLAARGTLTPRSSRDICARERAKERARHLTKLFAMSITSSANADIQGPARDNACRKCGAEIPHSLDTIMGLGFR